MTPGFRRSRRTLLAGVLSILLPALALVLTPTAPASAAAPCPTVIAHRGHAYYGAPVENSIGAFSATFGVGGKWIETDVQFTSDSVPVLMHDSTVDRTTTGTGYVARMTAGQFTSLTMNDGQHPPTLDQALELVRSDPDRRLIMEVKGIVATQEPVLTEKLRGLENQVYVNAFAPNLGSIQRLKTADPLLHISLVGYAPILPVPSGISGEDLEYTYVTAERVAQLHDAGMTVRSWVANSPPVWDYLRNVGVDAIMTDYTSAYLSWAATACSVVPADQTPPQVTLTSPADGATVASTVQVSGVSSDDVAVTTSSLLVDGQAVASVTTGGEISFDWNSATVTNGTHSLRLQARDQAGNIAESEAVSVDVQNVDDEDPSPPTALTATWSTPNHVALAWSGSSDDGAVTGYRVYRDGEKIADLDPSARSYSDAGVTNLTDYAYRVTALDAAGHESAPSEAGLVETGDDTAPTAPTVTAVNAGTGAVSVTWSRATDNAGVTGYRVHRNGVVIRTVDGATTSLLDSGLTDGVTYTYAVAALDAAGNASAMSNAAPVTTPDTTRPSAPAGLTRTVSAFTVRLTWKAATDNVGVTGYTVYRAGVAIGTTTTATTYTDTTAPPGKTYSYTVRARDAAANLSAASTAVSAALPVDRTAPTAPTALRATAGAAGTRRIVLTWNASTDNAGVTGYYLYRGNAKYRSLGKVLTFTDTGLTAGTKYTYKVYAIDATGNWSAPSGNISATAR